MGSRRGSSLARRKPFRQPRRRFTIFSEGKNTEPAYFNALKAQLRDAMVDINAIGRGATPSRVAQAAVAHTKANAPQDSFEDGDQVWVVFDKDTHADFDQAVALCKGNGVRNGMSIPCFEVWLILHVEDYARPDSSAKIQKHLQRLRPEYDPRKDKCPDCAELVLHVAKAEARAEALSARHKRDGVALGNPSTTVFELTREIHAAAEAASRSRK